MRLTDGWHDPSWPEYRSSPPWVMQEMIESEPALLERIVGETDASGLAALLHGPGPLTVAGCGTSEHAALGIAEMLCEAGLAVVAREAFEAALAPSRAGALVAVSHEGETWATVEALRAARAAGSRTGLVTACPEREAARHADVVVATPSVDRSWCHTVGYTSPLAAGVALVAALSAASVPEGVVRGLAERGLDTRAAARHVAAPLAGCSRLLVVGGGADRVSARELTLKIEEACYLPTAMRDLETLLHGHLPAADAGTGLVLVLCDRRAAARRRERAEQLLRACGRLGIVAAALATEPLDEELVPAGQVSVPGETALAAAPAALLGAALPLQLVALELAHARGTNPDLIRRHEEPYREAAAIVRE